MKLTGHKTESVYRRYAIVAKADLAEGVQKLARLHAAGAGRPRALRVSVAMSGSMDFSSASTKAQHSASVLLCRSILRTSKIV